VSTQSGTAHARSRRRRLADAAVGRLLKLPPATTDYTVTRDLRIPMRDGVELLADHYAPAGPAKGTLLVRGPYGFDLLSALYGSPFASRGYHVVLGRCRGTFGSGGAFEPLQNEVDDAADTVAWLREQPWFGGRFATIGASYLGFTQWGLLMDPPPELVTAVLQVALHDLSQAAYQGGAFTLDDYVGWADAVAHQEDVGLVRGQIRGALAPRRQRPALRHLPLAEATDALCKGRTPWFRDWATHRDLADPYWSKKQLGAALDRVDVPVLLQTGWQDLFLQQTLEQYDRLHGRGLDVALTVGPWTHSQMLTSGGSIIFPEALAWLDEHLAGTGSRIRSAPVGILVTGAGEWRDLPAWPPKTTEQVLHLQEGGGLGQEPAAGGIATFTYDPTDPTPTIGGRMLSTAVAGYRKDGALAERADVAAFTGPVLTEPLEVVGVPSVELAHASDNPHADLFVRISEVDAKGTSRNVTEGLVRLDPAGTEPVVRLDLDACAHRFAAGSRIRLLVAGGSFPHWERNLGTGEDPATGTAMAPSRRTIELAPSRLLLPVAG
jgi:putative CocE/NonD family hydrolase